MPILTAAPAPTGPILGVIPTGPGAVTVAATGGPAVGPLVAWALVADDQAPGGGRLDPVFLAAGQAWTPDQFRAVYGSGITLTVA